MIKKIEAIIREEALPRVKEALTAAGIIGLNVTEIRGRGRQREIEHDWHYSYTHDDLLTKVQVNIVLSERNVARTVDTIVAAAQTGKEGDGIIFVYPVDDVIRIRSGERGAQALHYPGDIDERGDGPRGAR